MVSIQPLVVSRQFKINPKRAYFTHISHRLGFHQEVSAALPENIFLAYDGLELDLSAEKYQRLVF